MFRQPESNPEMPVRTLGRTGVQVSLVGLGGWHLGFKFIDEDLSIRIIRTAIDSGINFMDNCWDYFTGEVRVQALACGLGAGDCSLKAEL